jgi:hypothetical protein
MKKISSKLYIFGIIIIIIIIITKLNVNESKTPTQSYTTSSKLHESIYTTPSENTTRSPGDAQYRSENTTRLPERSLQARSPQNTISSQSSDLIQKGLTSTNIKQISKTESFSQDVIIFDSIEKINNNINAFLNTYFPKIDINRINDSLIKSRNMIMQDIINNNILLDNNFSSLIILKHNDGFKQYLAYVLDLIDPTLFILFSLYIILIRKLNDNICDYYFNDYEIEKDFISYTGPCLNEDDIKQKYNELKDVTPSDGYNLNYTVINKISWRKSLRQNLINYGHHENILQTTSSTFNPNRVFEDALIKVFNKL